MTIEGRRLIAVLVVLAAAAVGRARAAEVPRVVRAYNDLGTVNAIAQTPDGFLWMAARAGLLRSDGVATRRFDEREFPELRSGGVRRLLVDREGALWIATGDGVLAYATPGEPPLAADRRGEGALVRYRDGRFARFERESGLPDPWVWALAQGGDGTIWVGTERGLARAVMAGGGVRFEAVACAPIAADPFIAALHVDARGTVWMATRRGVYLLRADGCVPGPLPAPVMALAGSPDGRVFAGTADGVVAFEGEQVVRRYGVADGLPSPVVSSLHVGLGAALLVGTQGGATEIPLDGNGPATTIPASYVVGLAEDRERSQWIGMLANGVLQRRPATVRLLGPEAGVPGLAFAVLAARDGGVWASTATALVHLPREGAPRVFRIGKELPTWTPRALAEARDGTLWIVGTHEGVIELRGGVARLHADPATIALRRDLRSVAIARDGALWLAWGDGSVTRHADGRPTAAGRTFTTADGLCGIEVLTMTDSPDGTMWVGSRHGLGEIKDGRARCWRTQDGLPAADVVALLADGDGTLWIGSRTDAGLVRMRAGRFSLLDPAQGWPRGGTYRLIDDGRGRLWWSSARGVHRAARADVEAVLDGRRGALTTMRFDRADGLGSDELISAFDPAGAIDGRGQLLFPSPQGIAVVMDPDAVGPLTRTAPVVDFVRGGGRVFLPESSGSIRAPAGTTELEFAYTAPTFLLPHRLRFEHRLDGVDDAWIAAGERRSAFYGNLGPGAWTLRVRVSDERGQIVPGEARAYVVIPPRPFQTWWFRALVVVAAVAGVAQVVVGRVRRVRERRALVREERVRIARDLHDHLGQGLGAVGLLADSIHLVTEASNGRARELVDRLRRVVKQTRQGVDELIWDLRAATAEPPDLATALRAVIDRAQVPGAPVIRLDVRGLPARLPGIVVHEVPFVVQEAITNAVKHGRATTVTVGVDGTESGRLRVAIRDDGVGLGATTTDRVGFGFVGMRERAQRMGGVVTLANAEPHGAVVTLDVPVR